MLSLCHFDKYLSINLLSIDCRRSGIDMSLFGEGGRYCMQFGPAYFKSYEQLTLGSLAHPLIASCRHPVPEGLPMNSPHAMRGVKSHRGTEPQRGSTRIPVTAPFLF